MHTLSSVPDDEKSLSTVFRVQYFFLVVCALLSLSLSLRVLYNPHSTIAQPNWYFPGLSHPSRQRQGKKRKKRNDWTSSDGQSCEGERLCLRLRSKSKSFIMRAAAAAAQALFFNISLSCTSFIQTRIHDFLFSLLRIFYLHKGELTQTLGPQIDDAKHFLPVFVI